jgi:GntR family transcriptional regulator, transcriptional repressor for pyruvate dehydrogenase complex
MPVSGVTPARRKASVLVAHALARRASQMEMGVARNTLREALRLLELQGVITIKAGPGGGPIVARPDHRPLAYSLSLALQGTDVSFLDLVKTRRTIEAELARQAATARDGTDVAELDASIERMRSELIEEDSFLNENLRFHDLVAAAARNRIMQLFHASLKEISDGHAIGVAYTPKHRTAVLKAHEGILDAIRDGDPDRAHDAMSAHMDEFEAYIRRRYREQLDRSIRWNLDGG